MTREEAIESLRGILTEAVEFENSVCYVTEEDREPLEMAIKALEQEPCEDAISRQTVIDAFHTWFRDGFDEDKWWNSTHVLAAIEGIPSVHQKHEWETCFDCPLSHGCPKIKGCTNEQAIEYASKIPNDCPLSAQPERNTDGDTISRQAVIDIVDSYSDSQSNVEDVTQDIISDIVALPPVTPQPKAEQFAKWVAGEIFDDMWEYNKDAFAEIACRKLAKLGIVIRMGDEWELIEPQESGEV